MMRRAAPVIPSAARGFLNVGGKPGHTVQLEKFSSSVTGGYVRKRKIISPNLLHFLVIYQQSMNYQNLTAWIDTR